MIDSHHRVSHVGSQVDGVSEAPARSNHAG